MDSKSNKKVKEIFENEQDENLVKELENDDLKIKKEYRLNPNMNRKEIQEVSEKNQLR